MLTDDRVPEGENETDETDEIVESGRAGLPPDAVGLSDVLRQMGVLYRSDPNVAVRGQGFI
jgi:hypothetical protein